MRRGATMLALAVAAFALAVAGSGPDPDGPDSDGRVDVGSGTVGSGTGPSTIAGTGEPTTTLPLPPAFPSTTIAPRHRSLVATATGASIDVFDSPNPAAAASRTFESPRPSGAEQVFLIIDRRGDWLNVMLPVRPNGSTGWIRDRDVSIAGHNYRIVVELGAHKLTVFNGDGVFHEEPVGVGVANTPTPGGRFYTVELFRSQKAAYGPYAYGLSGYSEVLYDFAGGDGQFGIHGTSDPSGLGTDVSNGCIRMSNEGITRLAETLPIGVPVEILA